MPQLKPEYRLGELLKEHNLTICTAESCTGGLLAHRITNIAGSSSYMLGAIVAYSNEIKGQVVLWIITGHQEYLVALEYRECFLCAESGFLNGYGKVVVVLV